MMQGDAFTKEIEILNANGEPVTSDDVKDVEITIGVLSKTLSEGEIFYEDGLWKFPISQEESFKFHAAYHEAQVRVLWHSGEIEGVNLGKVHVEASKSRRVLQ